MPSSHPVQSCLPQATSKVIDFQVKGVAIGFALSRSFAVLSTINPLAAAAAAGAAGGVYAAIKGIGTSPKMDAWKCRAVDVTAAALAALAGFAVYTSIAAWSTKALVVLNAGILLGAIILGADEAEAKCSLKLNSGKKNKPDEAQKASHPSKNEQKAPNVDAKASEKTDEPSKATEEATQPFACEARRIASEAAEFAVQAKEDAKAAKQIHHALKIQLEEAKRMTEQITQAARLAKVLQSKAPAQSQQTSTSSAAPVQARASTPPPQVPVQASTQAPVQASAQAATPSSSPVQARVPTPPPAPATVQAQAAEFAQVVNAALIPEVLCIPGSAPQTQAVNPSAQVVDLLSI